MRLPNSLAAWNTSAFAATLKRELTEHADQLPLQQALTGTSAVADAAIAIMILDARADAARIHVKIGVFFGGILAGCSCANDPTPVESQTEYCEIRLMIDHANGNATVSEAM